MQASKLNQKNASSQMSKYPDQPQDYKLKQEIQLEYPALHKLE